MPRFVQEKYQTNLSPYDDEASDHQWATAKSARTQKGAPGPQADEHNVSSSSVLYGSLPPGMDINDQEMIDSRKFNDSIAGNYPRGHNAGDVTQDCTEKSIKKGFDHKVCCPTDDMYTREHNDAFYDSIEMDGVEGFVERNNYLDRL